MGIFTRKQPPEERTLTTESAAPLLGFSGADQGPSPAGSLRISDAYACVRALADAAASLPLPVYRRTEHGRSRVGGRASELLSRPAPATTTANLVGQIVTHLNLHGNAYVGKLREDGDITRLSLLNPEQVAPEMKAGELVFHVATSKGMIKATEADIIHIRSAVSTDGLVGLSPVAQARTSLGLSRDLTEHARGTYANGGRPGGILKTQGGNDAIKRIKSTFQQHHGQASDAGKVLVLSGDLDYTPLAMNFQDAQFLEQRKYSAAEICRIFRVPPWIIGADAGNSLTYSNTEQQAQAFVTFSLRPWLVLIEQALSNDRDLCPGDTYCEFLLDGLLRADHKTRAEVYSRALDPDTGWMTRAEVRQLENLDQEAA